MKERPILFNTEMVNAILSGRKTQTRRAVKFPFIDRNTGCELSGNELAGEIATGNYSNSPLGQPGDRLWVRESFRVHSRATDVATLVYKASERHSWTEQTQRVPVSACNKPVSPEKWTPSIHMPRWASRIQLEIANVGIQRLQDISSGDVVREGICQLQASGRYSINLGDQYFGFASHSAKEVYSWLWESIYGDGSWQVNPWVWVIEFKRLDGEE